MPTSDSQRAIFSLLTVVVVLLVGIMALLQVADRRRQRLEDEAQDLRRTLARQKSQIDDLKHRLQECITDRATVLADSAWDTVPTNDSLNGF